MIDMSSWQDVTVDVVDGLLLDPHNVRLVMPTGAPQADIVQDLFTNEQTMSLLRSIVDLGWLTHEVPIVLKRDQKLVVVEGNRRVAALKAIQNPHLAPSFRAEIASLVVRIPNRDALKSITVKVAPSQDDANQLVAALHTGTQRRPWSPARQAAFFEAQLEAGKTASELMAQYPTVDVKAFIIRTRVLQAARAVVGHDDELASYVHTSRFPVSTFERLYENPEFLRLAGLAIDSSSASVAVEAPDSFSVVIDKVVRDLRSKRINSRILNKTTSDSYQQYMEELQALLVQIRADSSIDQQQLPPHEAGSELAQPGEASPRLTNITDPSPEEDGARAPSRWTDGDGFLDAPSQLVTSRPPRRQPASAFLDTRDLRVPPGFPPSVDAILTELGGLDIGRFPNAVTDLLRTLLEKCIKSYADHVGETIPPRKNARFVQLDACLVWLRAHAEATGQRAFLQPIDRLNSITFGKFVGTKTHLDAVNHNHNIDVAPEEVRQAWMAVHNVLRMMLS